MTRALVRERLERLRVAAKEVEDAMEEASTLTLLEQNSSEPMDVFTIWKGMQLVQARAKEATAHIRPGGGRDKLKASLDNLSALQACASVIFEAWKSVHPKYPAINNRDAQEAAEFYWQATGGIASDVASAANERWRDHLKVARNTNGLWRRYVKGWLWLER